MGSDTFMNSEISFLNDLNVMGHLQNQCYPCSLKIRETNIKIINLE